MADIKARNILIVDDSQTTRAMIKRVLGMLDLPGTTFREASDGAAALKLLSETGADLVLADLNMPGMDGYEMISRMRDQAEWKSIPVIVISAQPDPEQIEQLRSKGVRDYLPKPFTAEGVRNVLLPVLESIESAKASEPPMGEPINLTLAEALAQALETMAFISPQLMPPEQSLLLPADTRLIRINFKGHDTEGSLALAASNQFAKAMADSLEVPGEQAGDDALKELANITCGLMLRMRPGGGVGFQLDPPQLWSSSERSAKSVFTEGSTVMLEADGELIAAQIVTDAAFYGVC